MTTASAVPPAPLPVEPTAWWNPRGWGRVTPLKYAGLLFFAALILTPVYVLLVTSLKGISETDPSHAWTLPHVWTVSAWHEAWNVLSPNLKNSFYLVIPATVISTGTSRLGFRASSSRTSSTGSRLRRSSSGATTRRFPRS